MRRALLSSIALACALSACRAPGASAGAVVPVEPPAAREVLDARVEQLLRSADTSVALVSLSTPLPAHYHAAHEELVYVLRGEGSMQLGAETVALRPGLLIQIPRGVVHAVTPRGALHALSIFTPPFDGRDRVFVAPQG